MIYTIDELKSKVGPIAKKYRIPAVYLFGSYARNEATEDSDIDFLIDRTDSTIKSLLDMGGLYNDLSESVHKEIDLITTGVLNQENTKKRTPWFVDSVKREMVKIYG